MSDELRPCSHCGGDAIYIWCKAASTNHCYKCGGCGLLSASYETKDDAIAAWNRRTPEPMTSVVRWTRYDGTPPTLPEENRNVLITREYNARCFTWYCLVELYDWGCGVYVWEPYEEGAEGMGDVEVWAYLPQPPEGTE